MSSGIAVIPGLLIRTLILVMLTALAVTAITLPATDNAPASATEPASDPDNKTDKDEKGGNKTGLIIGIIAAVVVCGAVAALLIVKGKKSKK